MADHDSVIIPSSKVKLGLLELMEKEGFISGFAAEKRDNFTVFNVTLRYYENREAVIHGLKRVSKPGLRVYVKQGDIPRYYGGMGVAFLSTPKGPMTDRQARKAGVGGELLFYAW